MRNRYKRDLNRLIVHPKRNPVAKRLRTPGALNGTFSASSGLPRDPVQTDLDIYLLDDARRIIRMSPDLSEIKEVLVTGTDILSFAIHDGRYLYAQHDTQQPNTTNFVTFDNGTKISTNWDPNTDIRRIVGVNQTHSLIHFVDGVAQAAFIERYDRDGNFIDRKRFSDSQFNFGTERYWVIPATGDDVFISGDGPPDGREQGWFRFNLATGSKTFTTNWSKFWGDFCSADRYYMVDKQFNNARVDVYDLSLNLITTLPLNRNNPTSFCVTHNKAYCFFGGSALQQTFVQIYAKDGDTFVLEDQFDLNVTMGLRYIRVAMPDMAKVL